MTLCPIDRLHCPAKYIRIFTGCEVQIENSVRWITGITRLNEWCLTVILSDKIFNAQQTTIMDFFFLHTLPSTIASKFEYGLFYQFYAKISEPGREKNCLMSCANNKGTDQLAHQRSLISSFVVHCLDSVMSLVSVTKISSLMLASVAEQASLSLTSSETPEDTFSHDEAHLHLR